jgi:hypothetical protein
MSKHTEWLAKNNPAGLAQWRELEGDPSPDDDWRPAFAQLTTNGLPDGSRLPCRLRLALANNQLHVELDRDLHFTMTRSGGDLCMVFYASETGIKDWLCWQMVAGNGWEGCHVDFNAQGKT